MDLIFVHSHNKIHHNVISFKLCIRSINISYYTPILVNFNNSMLACQLHEDINGDGLKLIAYLAYIPDRCISTFMISSISSGIKLIVLMTSLCVRMSILCILNVNRYCTYQCLSFHVYIHNLERCKQWT